MNKSWLLAGFISLGLFGCASNMQGEHKDKDKEGDEVKVSFDQAPAAVKATLTKESNGAKIADVDKETDEGKTIYEADAMIGDKNYEIKVAEDGSLISKKIDDEKEEKADKKDKD